MRERGRPFSLGAPLRQAEHHSEQPTAGKAAGEVPSTVRRYSIRSTIGCKTQCASAGDCASGSDCSNGECVVPVPREEVSGFLGPRFVTRFATRLTSVGRTNEVVDEQADEQAAAAEARATVRMTVRVLLRLRLLVAAS